MKRLSFMIIAGEASGDALAAELVTAISQACSSSAGPTGGESPNFFGVGGSKMAAAGVELIFDLAKNAVWGLEALAHLWEYKKRFYELLKVAIERRPDIIICVDFGGFNTRFAHAVKEHVRKQANGSGTAWTPKIVQYVSPQVWASRPKRANRLALDVDLLLTIFPFEKKWYADRVPAMAVDFVGHPVVDRYLAERASLREKRAAAPQRAQSVVILPGSRPSELRRHLPIVTEALARMRAVKPGLQARMVLAEGLMPLAKEIGLPPDVDVRPDGLAEALSNADVAMAKSGTITLECAFFGVPTVTLYKTHWLTWEIGRRIVNVKWVSMPNILANEEIFPELLQERATAENIARTALEFLDDPVRRNRVKARLEEVVVSLGAPGASRRAADAILALVQRGTATNQPATGQGTPVAAA